jgi:hypothetical protein
VRTGKELPGRSPIALGQARLTLEFFADELPEKKLQLIGMSILLILLSPGRGCYSSIRFNPQILYIGLNFVLEL